MDIDNINYSHRLSNFIEAKEHALKLVGLLKGSLKVVDGDVNVDVGSILSNIGSPEMQVIEKFIMKYMTVSENGNEIRLATDIDINNHFNKYRSHYFKIIIDGALFHFKDFLPDGLVSATNINL